MFVITSFFDSNKLLGDKYSVAVYQPTGYSYPKLHIFEIADDDGNWIRPREFLESRRPLEQYQDTLYGLYLSRKKDITTWVDSVKDKVNILCCWCPHDKAAQRQLRQFGSFVCHTAVVAEFLEQEYNLPVLVDGHRQKMKGFHNDWISSFNNREDIENV